MKSNVFNELNNSFIEFLEGKIETQITIDTIIHTLLNPNQDQDENLGSKIHT
jgi:hypothetical protein